VQLLRHGNARLALPCFLVFFCLGSCRLLAAPIDTLIIMPDVSGAAKIIYDQVVAGVESNPSLNTTLIKINQDDDETWLASQLARHKPRLVIPIGNRSYKLCHSIRQQDGLPENTRIVAGGISGKPNGIPTLSLTGSPFETISQIKNLAPEVRDIRLVYNEKLNGWWYKQAKELANSFNLEVIGYHANDLQHGVKLYSTMMQEANRNTSAIWIPLKSIVPSKTILPLVLEKAWAKKLPVISNNPSHTRLGGLMALYPHHHAMGQQLAEFALAHYNSQEIENINGTDTLRMAINVRTSAHLGLRLNDSELERFDKVFPTMP